MESVAYTGAMSAPASRSIHTARGVDQGIMKDISRVVRGLLPPNHYAVLFGSRATGASRPRSDWDIGLAGPGPLDGAIVERIRETLEELPTLSTFDVVDLAAAPAGLRERALREGVAF